VVHLLTLLVTFGYLQLLNSDQLASPKDQLSFSKPSPKSPIGSSQEFVDRVTNNPHNMPITSFFNGFTHGTAAHS